MPDYELTSILSPDVSPLEVIFLILPGASLMSVASAIDPLRAANRIEQREVFRWQIVTPDGEPAATTCGIPVVPNDRFRPERRTDLFVVVASFGAERADGRLLARIARASNGARATCGIEAGSWLLARSGLLNGHKATTHWEDFEDFAAAFPDIDVVPDRYVIDRRFLTTGGASPTFDLMLHIVRMRHGMATALDVASVFIYEQASTGEDAQPLVSLGRLDDYDPRFAHAVRLMEASIDAPVTVAALAKRCSVTTRTLENVFEKTIGESPGAYFLRLRLSAARRLVRDSRMPLADIAARTGFSSAAAFSRAFRRAYGQSPSGVRSD
ncbi:GlxA family transcriptional regulator [Pararhizobium mangrovi]|uniref:GlxA family transcriptional regulator n=1 Tax=Pararhizobium mangrovi TaxID=2590452 RepID=A0A506U0S0_9HYPH|nr:GlxA family transcriptional regulator [Pararhizobium mangrovi]TPW27942.1 GlxA family transcriptional regulator [Pararhizobium mangrovi]